MHLSLLFAWHTHLVESGQLNYLGSMEVDTKAWTLVLRAYAQAVRDALPAALWSRLDTGPRWAEVIACLGHPSETEVAMPIGACLVDLQEARIAIRPVPSWLLADAIQLVLRQHWSQPGDHDRIISVIVEQGVHAAQPKPVVIHR